MFIIYLDKHLGDLVILFILVVALSLFLLIRGIINYKQFVEIEDDTLCICKKHRKQTTVLRRIEKSSIKEIRDDYGKVYAVTDKDEKIKLLDPSPSIIAVVLTLPVIAIPIIYKWVMSLTIVITKLNEYIGKTEVSDQKKKNLHINEIAANILSWFFMIPVIFMGFLGVLFTFFKTVTFISLGIIEFVKLMSK
jgi:hypothetical protein